MIEIYTDGSSRNQNSKYAVGGIGVIVLEDGHVIETFSKQFPMATNNQMEMKAIIYATIKYGIYNPIIYSDSAYAINAFSQWMYSWHSRGWIKGDGAVPLNLDLIKTFYFLAEKCKLKVQFQKVKGHSNNFYNELADRLAIGEFTPQQAFILARNYEKIKK